MSSKTNVTVVLFLVFTASCLSTSPRGMPSTPFADTRGVFSLSDPNKVTDPKILSNPAVDGIALRTTFNKVEPKKGIFNWTFIDQEIANARANHKKLSLSVEAGYNTPQWVYDEM